MKKFYWIESTMKIPNLHNEAVQCQIFKALNVFCSSNLSIIFLFQLNFMIINMKIHMRFVGAVRV